MSQNTEIFSIRIVIADFYLEKPVFGLDPCYSEFRGKEIKKVPIIRIFGSNGKGQKTCMHVHGVFPYFYIPYESKDFESQNKAIYQIAFNIDKAINISLGQTQSSTQHVFKIQLVKGIPFYGYHRHEHQYLKIYMYNPRFVRRAANLLQNGSVLGKIFHPHESHVPYVLQFMIDYNLYGMSFLHVPIEVIKFRRNNETDTISFAGNIKETQILNCMLVKKQSCSALEIDIGSNFILNRFQLVAKSKSANKHSNPGVEAIWHDEDVRRRKLISSLGNDEEKINAIPPLEIPATQERPNIQPTESDTFYRIGLLSKLLAFEESSNTIDQTLNSTIQPNHVTLNAGNISNKEMRRTFNLKKLLVNSVYPEECSPDEQLVDASCIENHLSAKSFLQTNSSDSTSSLNKDMQTPPTFDESTFLDDTIIDEEILLNQTEAPHVPLNATLRHEDMELLEVFQQLEEQNELDNPVDLDSSLAPLSQLHENHELTPKLLDKETIAIANSQILSDNESESENEADSHLLDFSIALDDIDELLLKLSQPQLTEELTKQTFNKNIPLPQIDGADDALPKTPEKVRTFHNEFKSQMTPPRSPRTPKNSARSPRTPKSSLASRYAPLPLIITNRSVKKNLDQAANTTNSECDKSNTKPGSPIPLRKRLAMTKMRRKTISSAKELCEVLETMDENKSNSTGRRSRKSSVDLDRTHVTCALTPLRRSERLLKFCNVESVPKTIEQMEKTRKTSAPRISKQKSYEHKPKKVSRKAKTTLSDNSKKNLYGLKKVLVRIPKRNLAKLAEEFKISRANKTSLNNVRNGVDKNTSNEFAESELSKISISDIVESNKNDKQSREMSKIEQKLTITDDDHIRRNLSQLLKVFQPGIEPKSLFGDSRHSPLSLNRYRREKDSNKNAKQKTTIVNNVDHKPSSSGNNIEKNLSELMKVLQNSNQKIENESKSTNAIQVEEQHEQSFDSTITTLRLSESPEENVNDNDLDEIITASDTEADNNTSLRRKKTPGLGSLRRHLRDTPTIELRNSSSPGILPTQKMFDLSITLNSPSLFSECSSPLLPDINTNEKSMSVNLKTANHQADGIILTPLMLPPTREETLETCKKLQIYEYEFQKPFYSNPDDITKAKEIGFTVLQIPGNKLSDCPEFESVLGKDSGGGLTEWRRKKLFEIGGSEMLQRYRNIDEAREFFAKKTRIVIEPQQHPPSRHDAKVWLKAKELLQKRDDTKEALQIDQDSPIKIRRQKVTMMFSDEAESGTSNNDIDGDEMDCSSCSLTLTPLTPSTPLSQNNERSLKELTDMTPLTTSAKLKAEMSSSSRKSKRRAMRMKPIRTSLHEKLKAAADKDMTNDGNLKHDTLDEVTESLPSSQHSNTSSHDSSSISSQVVLAELDRSSFVKQLQSDKNRDRDGFNYSYGLSSASLDNTFGFKVNLENLQDAKADVECNNLTTIAMELFVMTRDDLYPNPEYDEIRCIFYAIENNISTELLNSDIKNSLGRKACGYILVNDFQDLVHNEGNKYGLDADIEVRTVKTEVEALENLLQLCSLWDPDIYAGYEIEMSSWGYLIDRAKFLCLNIAPLLSRVPSQKVRDFVDEDQDQLTDLDVEMKLCGRILLDVWRLMRSEIALTSYTFENVMYHILHKRCPLHSYRDLALWFSSPCSRWIVLEYYLERVRGIMALLDQLDLLGRTSEMAKLIGIQFYEVLSRGSQFRVESMMLRIAKPRNLVPLSPSVQQRAHMRAPEYLPLILEPQSRFYADPLIVLDFQSLYPSMIIAYNYCFSTCLGRVEHLGQSSPFEFGASQLRVSPTMLRKLIDEDLVNISPCGVVFVKSKVREGILPRMLTEILDTRLMVKQSMKLHKSNSALQRILHSRQLGLKLMANVTYGYTAANFSGRMPAVEVGDSVVAKGRETLERTIKMVEANEKWGVKVVYGDTDSLFVLVPGRNREQAFQIGEEIAIAATKDNPHPVKLKLEKVYQPCILQTKKRYVGYMYETPDQTEPVYEAKGIETVRRDGCPAVAKMLEKVLRILFETTDVSQIKQYVCRQFTKILSGRANLQDLIFAKEFRGLNGYRPTACVPALELTRKWIQTDPRRIPRRGERVPFIITNGPPGVPLIRLVRSPYDVLSDGGLKINSIYYITKAIIPPLNRCLLLIGADVNEWFTSLPRKILMTPALSTANQMISTNQQQKKSTISQYFSTTNCVIECGRHTKEGICNECAIDSTKCTVVLNSKIAKMERAFHLTQEICQACCGRVGDLKCKSLDCPVLYVLEVKCRELKQIDHFRRLLEKF